MRTILDKDGALDHIFDEQKDGSWKKREGVKNDGGSQNHAYVSRNGDVSYFNVGTNKMSVVKAGTFEKKINEYRERQVNINKGIENTGNTINNAGDVIATAGYVAAPFTEGTSLVISVVGEAISFTGAVIKHSAKVNRDGFTNENVTDMAVDGAFELAPAPFEIAIKKSNLDEPAKKILRAETKKVILGTEKSVEKFNDKK